jgi:hypothetical protein
MTTSGELTMHQTIEKYFTRTEEKIFRPSKLAKIFAEERGGWGLPRSMKFKNFLELASRESPLHQVRIAFPSRPEVRYIWGEVPLYSLMMTLKPGAFFSHFTAMFIHDLTDQAPYTIFLNHEQPPPVRRESTLSQAAINAAFSRPARRSENVAAYGDYRICLLKSMGGAGVGIIEVEGFEGELIRVTNIERTLIDIAVRPNYSGGIFEVLEAYRRAKDKVSLNRLAAYLKQMNYLYPYHQVIGFYLERAGGYDESEIGTYFNFPIEYDFYLVHGIKETEREYSEKWRLFYPKGF